MFLLQRWRLKKQRKFRADLPHASEQTIKIRGRTVFNSVPHRFGSALKKLASQPQEER